MLRSAFDKVSAAALSVTETVGSRANQAVDIAVGAKDFTVKTGNDAYKGQPLT
jgi:predicted alpha/beta superfamily hydrolase